MNTNSTLYGKGIFTSVKIKDGKTVLWQKHWRRIDDNADTVGIDLSSFQENPVREKVEHEAECNNLHSGRARITFLDEGTSDLWPSSEESKLKTTCQIILGETRPLPDSFIISDSPYPVNSHSPLAGVKSCNYLEQILSLDETKGRGFHEAVRVNERGHVTSGCISNIFWLKDDRLYTPTLATGCLAGTTREHVLENIECEEVEADIGELGLADAIYLTSAGLGIVRVAEFDGRELPDTKHPIQTLWPPS